MTVIFGEARETRRMQSLSPKKGEVLAKEDLGEVQLCCSGQDKLGPLSGGVTYSVSKLGVGRRV